MLVGRRLAATLVVLCVCVVPQGARAGAFLLDPGHAKLFVSGLLTDGGKYYDARGKLRSRGRYSKADLQFAIEYGLTEKLTGFAQTAAERIVAEDGEKHERKGLGRSEFGLRAQVFKTESWVGSIQASAVIAGARKKDGVAAVGESDDQFDIRGLIAHSFEVFGKHAFIDAAFGYRKRTGDPADELRFDSTLGVWASDRLLLMAQSFVTVGTGRWRGAYPLTQRILKIQMTTYFRLTDSISAYLAGFTTPIGRDALEERGCVLGLEYRF